MIDLRQSDVKGGSNEIVLSEQMISENIPFRFGQVRAGTQRQDAVFLANRYAISFNTFNPVVEANLKTNRIVPQVWNKGDLFWRALSLRNRINLHR